MKINKKPKNSFEINQETKVFSQNQLENLKNSFDSTKKKSKQSIEINKENLKNLLKSTKKFLKKNLYMVSPLEKYFGSTPDDQRVFCMF